MENGPSYLVHKPAQGRVRLKRRGFAFCLDAREVRPAFFCVAPVVQESAAMESAPEYVGWVRSGTTSARDDCSCGGCSSPT